MKYIPSSMTRFIGRSGLRLRGASPTMLVVGGVVGLGATAVMAARATRNLDPVLDAHHKARLRLEETVFETKQDRQASLARLYGTTTVDLARLYGPTLVVGGLSAAAVLGGHKILRKRHIATVAAYTGLIEQFQAYRGRVVKTLGAEVERGIYEGAHGEWTEDPDHKGEYKLTPKFDPDASMSYLRPWFDEANANFYPDATANYSFLTGSQSHWNRVLQIRGYVFLNEVLKSLGMPQCREGQQVGWTWDSPNGDNLVDYGFMSSIHPETVEFREGLDPRVRLNFNIDGPILDVADFKKLSHSY